jgi:ferredoxin/cytochrome c2
MSLPQTPGIDWPARQKNAIRRLLNRLERFSLWLEAPLNRLVRDPRFNPLYHTGTLSVFLLLVILLTGVYLTMFYQFGFEASYRAVGLIESNWIGRLMRALHRYASAAALITALLHGWRTLVMDRLRGPRALAWVTGVWMAVMVWAAGVTGYWLIWDERAQLLTQSLVELLQGWEGGRRFALAYLLGEQAGSGWIFMVILISLHIGLFLLLAGFLWYHLVRLSRAKWLPPQFWSWAGLALLTLASILLPAGMLPPANPAQTPAQVPLDVFFLFFFFIQSPLLPWLLLSVGVVIPALLSLLPWLPGRAALKPIQIQAERCTGCTLCAADCPYKALTMVERTDGLPHKYIAQLDPALCVACGVCIGSCPTLALRLTEQQPEALWEYAVAQAAQRNAQPVQVVFTCERHAQHGAANLLAQSQPEYQGQAVRIVPLTCIGMAHPELANRALAAGAAEVKFIGCPPEDCANREGNLWMQQRLAGERLPKFRPAQAGAVVAAAWLPPDQFQRGLSAAPTPAQPASAYALEFKGLNWRHFLPAFGLLALALLLQLGLTNLPYHSPGAGLAGLQISLEQAAGAPLRPAGAAANGQAMLAVEALTQPVLQVWLDGELALAQPYQPGSLQSPASVLAQLSFAPGQHNLRLEIHDTASGQSLLLLQADRSFAPGQQLYLQYRPLKLKGDPQSGERLFFENSVGVNAGCMVCHSLEPGVRLVGPSLAGIGSQAGGRVPGLSAEEYIRQSILQPKAFTVPDYPAEQMPANLAQILSAEQINDLVAFLLTLE